MFKLEGVKVCRRIYLGLKLKLKKVPSLEASHKATMDTVIKPSCKEMLQRSAVKLEIKYL